MTTTEQNPAREEYFDQLINECADYLECPSPRFKIQADEEVKERILSITYDGNVALQKRVEELEAALDRANKYIERNMQGAAYMQFGLDILTKQS